jgi:light-regulated signal transduction histidine kinase (bacteriophytochrome)
MLSQIQSQNEEITSFSQQLEDKVVLRTKELEHANRELESFSYSVSHDLRAPLRKINSFLNMFTERAKGTLDKDSQALLSRVEANANKMGRLIDDLLAFARLGKMQVRKQLIPMNRVVKDLSDEILKHEDGRKIDFRIRPLPEAYADPAAITHVWENLISNAVKYTTKREVAQIEIGAQHDGGEVVYFIHDNGSGFDMAHYHKLFTAFERLHGSNEFEGTGVGLAIVQRIIEKHGGRIWASSETGKGSSFYFSLPEFRPAPAAADAP